MSIAKCRLGQQAKNSNKYKTQVDVTNDLLTSITATAKDVVHMKSAVQAEANWHTADPS